MSETSGLRVRRFFVFCSLRGGGWPWTSLALPRFTNRISIRRPQV